MGQRFFINLTHLRGKSADCINMCATGNLLPGEKWTGRGRCTTNERSPIKGSTSQISMMDRWTISPEQTLQSSHTSLIVLHILINNPYFSQRAHGMYSPRLHRCLCSRSKEGQGIGITTSKQIGCQPRNSSGTHSGQQTTFEDSQGFPGQRIKQQHTGM